MTADETVGTAEINYDAWRTAIRRDALSNYHYSMARAITREGNASAAIEHLHHAIAADGRMIPAYAELAMLLRAEGRVSEAEAAELTAKTLSPDWSTEALLRRGKELMAVGRSEEALQSLEATANWPPALRLQAEEIAAEIRFARVLQYRSAGDPDGAATALRSMIGYEGNNPLFLGELCLRLIEDGDWRKATTYAMKAARLSPPDRRPEFDWHAANLLFNQFRFQESVSFLEERIEMDPDWTALFVLLGSARIMLGQFSGAERVLRQAIALDPARPVGWLHLGYACSGTNSAAVAEFFQRTLRCLPGHFVAQAELAMLLAQAGRHEEAIAQGEEARSKVPDAAATPLVAVPQVITLLVANRPELARAVLQTAIAATEPKDRVLFWLRARFHPNHLAPLTALFAEVRLDCPVTML